MDKVCRLEKTKEDFPVTMCVNGFRGFMNEWMAINRLEADKPKKTKRKKEKKRKTEDPVVHLGHSFVLTIINIPTACEVCSSFFMWPIERGLVCQNCKLTCHKKCYTKVVGLCSKDTVTCGRSKGPNAVFGVPLESLIREDGKIPVVVDRLITTIEIHGLYTEGIYRKPGVNSKVQELKAKMDEGNLDSIQFDKYHVHVLASVLKSFLREMPEPLLTFDHYDDLLRAADLSEDRVNTIYAILNKLPQVNFDLLERIVFHLARVALYEEANRMSANALATVFAPCLLRTDKAMRAQDSLQDISRQTTCIEVIVMEQMRRLRATLIEIDTLDTACVTVSHRLSSIRSSKVFTADDFVGGGLQSINNSTADNSSTTAPARVPASTSTEEEEVILMGHIEEIQKEKALLTSTLPSLTRSPSDDDLLSTDGSLDDVEPSQTLSRHRVIHKHKKRGSEASTSSMLTPPDHPPSDRDPIMV